MRTVSHAVYADALKAKAERSRHPDEVTFELTYGCNLRCAHCYNPTHRALPHELTTEEVCRLLTDLADFGILTVTFTGGEPSLRPDIATILRSARRRGLVTQVLSNATRITPAFVAVLQEVGAAQVNVSIYGATEATYERVTGVTGSYRAFLSGLRMLAELDIPVSVRMPVTTLNDEDIGACRKLVEGLGLKFQYCLDIMPRVTGHRIPLKYRLDPARKVFIDRTFHASSGAVACAADSFITCACGQSRFAITPYGEMNLCTAFPIPRYDLRRGTVRDGWALLKRTVDEARPGDTYACSSCSVRPYCRQGRSDAWLEAGDMSACLPHFKEWAELESRTDALLDPRRPG